MEAAPNNEFLRTLSNKLLMSRLFQNVKKGILILNIDPNLDFPQEKFVARLNLKIREKIGGEEDQNFMITLFTDPESESLLAMADVFWLDDLWENNISEWDQEKIKKNKLKKCKYAENMFNLYLLNSFFSSIGQKNIYLAYEWRKGKTHEKLLSNFKTIFNNDHLGTIGFEYKGDKKGENSREIYLNTDLSDFNVSFDEMLSEECGVLQQLFQFRYLGNRSQELGKELHAKKSEVQSFILSILDIAHQVISQVLEERNFHVEDVFESFVQSFDGFEELKNSSLNIFQRPSQSQLQSSIYKGKINQQKLRVIFFIYEFQKIYRSYENEPDTSRNGKQFIQALLEAFKKISSKVIKSVEAIVSLLFDQINQLKYFSKQDYFNSNIVGKCSKWVPKSSKILDIALRMTVQHNYDENYYNQLLELSSIQLLRQDFQSNDSCLIMKEKIKIFNFKVNYIKNKTVFTLYLGKDNVKAAQAIRNLLNLNNKFHEMRSQIKNKQIFEELEVSEIEILSLIAQSLKGMNRTDLALQIYKVLKFVHPIEECFEEISILKPNQSEKVQMMINLSQYFQEIGENKLSQKYAQMAYEASPTKLNFLIEVKKANISKDSSQLESLNKIEKQNPSGYFYKELPEQFWAEIQKLSQRIPQQRDNLKVTIKRKKLNKILNR